jgi:hypothetical protein
MEHLYAFSQKAKISLFYSRIVRLKVLCISYTNQIQSAFIYYHFFVKHLIVKTFNCFVFESRILKCKNQKILTCTPF